MDAIDPGRFAGGGVDVAAGRLGTVLAVLALGLGRAPVGALGLVLERLDGRSQLGVVDAVR